MPYIQKEERKKYNSDIRRIQKKLLNTITDKGYLNYSSGDLNYVLSSIIWKLFDVNESYTNGNQLVGVLECVKQEFIRRRLNNYEDEKIAENGDL